MGVTFDESSRIITVLLNSSLYDKESILDTITDFKEVCELVDLVNIVDGYFNFKLRVICDEPMREIGYGFTNYVLGVRLSKAF